MENVSGRNDFPPYRLVTNVIAVDEERWGFKRQRIGRKGSESSVHLIFVCSHSLCSTHIDRYNMIFVETSAKDNTGVEQVTIFSILWLS